MFPILSSKRHSYNPHAVVAAPVRTHSLLSHHSHSGVTGGVGGDASDRVAALEHEVKRLTEMMTILSRQVQTLLAEDLKKAHAITKLEDALRRDHHHSSDQSHSHASAAAPQTNHSHGTASAAAAVSTKRGTAVSFRSASPSRHHHSHSLSQALATTSTAAPASATAASANGKSSIERILAELNMSEYLPAFNQNKVTDSDLHSFTESDLTKLVPEAGPRRRLLTYIESGRSVAAVKTNTSQLSLQLNSVALSAAAASAAGASSRSSMGMPSPSTHHIGLGGSGGGGNGGGAMPSARSNNITGVDASSSSSVSPAAIFPSASNHHPSNKKPLTPTKDEKAGVASLVTLIGGRSPNSGRTSKKRIEDLTDDEKRILCMVCGVENRSTQFAPCNHIATCESCAYQTHTCPICGVSVTVNQLSLW